MLSEGQTQMPLLGRDDLDNDNEKMEIEGSLFEVYTFKYFKLTNDWSMTMLDQCDHKYSFINWHLSIIWTIYVYTFVWYIKCAQKFTY